MMNEPYSSWTAWNSAGEVPLAGRYQSADPIVWHGSMVYPMYTEQIGPSPTTVTVALVSAAPPAGLRGLGIGLSVVDGYVDLHGRALSGVDAWSDALAAGVGFDVTPTAPGTLVTLTPVWVDEFGTQKSWVGNYGIVIEHRADERVVLWCSIGEGPPNFANLVVEVSTGPTVVAPAPPTPGVLATAPIAVSAPATPPEFETAPTMPVPRIDASPPPAAPTSRPQDGSPPAANDQPAVIGPAAQSIPAPRAGSLFANLQASRTTRPTPDAELPTPTTRPTPDAESPTPTTRPTPDAQVPTPTLHVSASTTGPALPPGFVEQTATIDTARTDTETAQSGDPGYRGALYDLGVAMYSRGEEEQACGLWAQAAEAGHAGAAYELGAVRYRHGDSAGAEHWWRTAADLREPRAIAGLADLLGRQDDHDEANAWPTPSPRVRTSGAVGQPTPG